MKLLSILFIFLFTLTTTYSQVVRRFDLTNCVFGSAILTICEGDTVKLYLRASNNCSISPGYDTFLKLSDYDQVRNQCSFKIDRQNRNALLDWSGPNISLKNPNVGSDQYGAYYARMEATPVASTTFTVTWEDATYWEETPCEPSHFRFDIYSASIAVIVRPRTPQPTLVASNTEINSSRALVLRSTGCLVGQNLIWTDSQGQGMGINFEDLGNNSIRIKDPYACLDYKVRCDQPGCPQYLPDWSPSINGAAAFKPGHDPGYSAEFAAHLNRLRQTSAGHPEYPFRQMYYCLQGSLTNAYLTNPNGYAGIMGKYLMDRIATNPCASPLDGVCASNVLFPGMAYNFCPSDIALFKSETNEIRLNYFFLTPRHIQDIGRYLSSHIDFINNSLKPCLADLSRDPYFSSGTLWFDAANSWQFTEITQGQMQYSKLEAEQLTLPNIYWNEAQRLVNLSNDISRVWIRLPPPRTKSDIISPAIESASVHLISTQDNQYFLSTNRSYSIVITQKPANGGQEIDPSSGHYALSVSADVATIDSLGVLHIHKMPLPMINERFPILVFVRVGSDFSVGQFAIYDTDADGDQLNDTYETSIGLSITQRNDGLSDLDQDNILDQFEVMAGTNPLSSDSDGDGYSDALEIQKETNPINSLSSPYFIKSIVSGAWSNPATWSCNCLPSADDDVWVQSNHTVELDTASANAQSIRLEGKINTVVGGKLTITQPYN